MDAHRKPRHKSIYFWPLVFDREARYTHRKKDCIFINGAGQTGWLHEESKQIHSYHSAKKLNSKWIKDIKIKLDILSLIEDKVGNSLEVTGIGKRISEQSTVSTDTKLNNY